MDTKEYIASGILEAYTLGALTQEERAQVEANIALYPEVAAEFTAIEAAMLEFAAAHSVEPPAHLQQKIWSALQTGASFSPTVQGAPKLEPKTIPLTRTGSWQRAAVWAALVGSVLLNIVLWSQRNQGNRQDLADRQSRDSIRDNAQQTTQLASQYKDTAEQYRTLAERYKNEVDHFLKEKEMVADPGMLMIVMHATKKDSAMAATVYWSKDKGEAYVSIEKLPAPPAGMQYQMWVIQKGKPVSMGMLSNTLVADAGMTKMDMQVTDGQAFAISLEKAGGNPTPTAANIYVMGKVSS